MEPAGHFKAHDRDGFTIRGPEGKRLPALSHSIRRCPMAVTFAVSIDSETCNRFSTADPNDPGMLDVVGFDTTPQLVSDFARGAR